QKSLAIVTAEVIFSRNSPAVVQIVTQDSQGLPQGTGSGFFVSATLVVTNHHVIRKAHTAQVVLSNQSDSATQPISVVGVAGDDGKVIGVTTAFIRGGQNLNLAVPSSCVANLLLGAQEERLSRLPLPQQMTALDYAKRGYELLGKGEFKKAIPELDAAIALDP